MDPSAQAIDSAVAAAERHLEQGEPLAAYNAAQEGLAAAPAHARLRQLQALALARSGATERANALLQALARDGIDDAETLGMLARTHKDLAIAEPEAAARKAHLDAGFTLYESAYERARRDRRHDAAWYTGINAATLAVLRGDLRRGRRIAAQVRDICLAAESPYEKPSERYWREATLGEAALVLGDAPAAHSHYARARALAGRRFGDISSTRKQARLLAQHVALDGLDLEEALRMPPVVVFTGHMVDRADRGSARFPASLESAVAEAVRQHLAAIAPLAVYGSAACGADLLCLEAAREIGAETHIVLPFPAADFHASSVDFAGGRWSQRFDEALSAATSVTVTSDHHARGSTATFEYANVILTGMGMLRAQVLDAPLRALAVHDAAGAGAPGGASSLVALWKKQQLATDTIDLGALRGDSQIAASDPAPDESSKTSVARHELRAMLFADAVGYSKLSEDQIPGYIEGFLGSVAALSRRTRHRFEHVETSGDGLYMVFRSVRDAGRFALELNAMVNAFDRARWGLPPNFDLRVALHCGPVHCATDPITGNPIYTGPHTSRAARIEPVTPPSQVYASSAFAAVAAAGGEDFALRYVGRMPLAKGYGALGLYHLAPRRSTIDR